MVRRVFGFLGCRRRDWWHVTAVGDRRTNSWAYSAGLSTTLPTRASMTDVHLGRDTREEVLRADPRWPTSVGHAPRAVASASTRAPDSSDDDVYEPVPPVAHAPPAPAPAGREQHGRDRMKCARRAT